MPIKIGTESNDINLDTLIGTNQNDEIFGLGGNDHLIGLAGDDLLDGGSGIDRMEGGLGNDTFIVDDFRDQVLDTGGYDIVKSSAASFTIVADIEQLNLTGSGNIDGFGNNNNNLLNGNSGNLRW